MHVIKADAGFIDDSGSEGVGVPDGGALGVFKSNSGTGIAAIGQSGQWRRADVFPSACE